MISGFYPILDPSLASGHDPFYLAEALLSAGAPVFQLRQKKMAEDDFLKLAMRISYLRVHNRFKLVLNSFVHAAKKVEADGIHLPAASTTSVAEARKILGPKILVGISVHSVEEGVRRAKEGADYLTFGAIYPSSAKPEDHPVQGIERLRELAQKVSIPMVAIGGITLDRVPEIKGTGASAFSALSPIYQSDRPTEVVRKLAEAWQ